MPTAREDYLIRLIQQLGEVLRRLRGRLAGAPPAADLAAIEREAAQAVTTLLGPQAPLLHRLDAASAVRLLGDAQRVALWVGLLRAQADAQRAAGRVDSAERLVSRAGALEQAAQAAWP